jgi:hypothetical protein
MGRPLQVSSALGIGVLCLLGSCKGERRPPQDSAQTAPPPAASTSPPVAATVTPAQFRALKWLEGRWRGRDTATLVFYEEYRFVDDSTLAMRSFSDSMFTRATDSSTIALRGGRVENRSESRTWVATRLDSASARFDAASGAGTHFVWERATDGWVARLFAPAARGEREVVYRMTTMRR